MRAREARLVDEARTQLARRSSVWFAFFAQIFTRALRSDFHAVRLSLGGPPPDAVTPRLVVYANHPSWWDAAVFTVLIARLFPGRVGRAPIDAAMMRRYGFMARIGAFGVEQETLRGAAVFLATAAEILADPAGLIFVTPQGRFTDARERPLRFAPGLVHLAERCPDATFVPLALDYPFWDERKPELLLRFGEPVTPDALAGLGRAARQEALTAQLEATMDALAAEALARKAAAFATLIGGSEGVGGVYDLWRRARATVRGERFTAAHGGTP